jgi:hypothetical protein
MRNVVSLSDIPMDLHDWLKKEAIHQSDLIGKRVCIYQVVVQAIREYKEKSEKHNAVLQQESKTASGEIMRKKLKPAEVQRGCVCVPIEKREYFPAVGHLIRIQDAKDSSCYDVLVGSQHRLGMKSWYHDHSGIRAGDEIIFEQANGTMRVDVCSGE